jgi:hypothetical protein
MGLAACIGFFGVLWAQADPRPAYAMKHVPQATPNPAQPTPLPVAPEQAFPPGRNFALRANGGTAIGGTDPEQLIDGNDSNYSGGTGFATTQWRNGQYFLITLKKPVTLDSVRFLLWDRSEERYYRYKLEICADDKGSAWTMAQDRSGPIEQCKSWQVIRFKPQIVKQIKLTGTFNSANNGFHVVELQAYNGCPPQTPTTSPDTLDF